MKMTCIYSGGFVVFMVKALKRRFTVLLIGIITLANLTSPLISLAQSLPDTVIMNQYIKGKKIINTTVLIIGKVEQNKQITLRFVPEFREQMQVLDQQQISKYELDYFFDPTLIRIEPSGYFKLADKDRRIQTLKNPVSITFESLKEEFKSPFATFEMEFTLVQGKESVSATSAIKLPLPVKPEPDPVVQTRAEVESDISDENSSTGDDIPKQPGNRSPKAVQPATGTQANADLPVSEVNELVTIVNEIKLLFNLVHNMKMNMETVPVEQGMLNQQKLKVEQLKITFDTKYMMGNFEDPEAANRIFNVFSEYYNTTTRLIAEMSTGQPATVQRTGEQDQSETKGSDSTEKLFLYLVIFIAVIVVAFIVIILIMKMSKNKKSLNLQKQLQRKAQMELNKQKFQATKQKSKLKI
jgi:preprotein translocase subunit SecG